MADKLKAAIIGCGTWGKVHARIYGEHPGIQLIAICDLSLDRAERFASEFGIPSAYSDYNEMLAKSQIDLVSIVTPDFTHGQIAVDCANAGKHMLVEKPLATTRRDVEAIAKAVERNGVRMMVDFHNRWSPPFVVAKASLDDGDLGEPVSAYFRLNDVKWVATDLLSWSEKSSILWFLGSHSVDVLRWFFNDEVDRVYSVSHSGVLRSLGVDTIDVYQTILEFRRGGIATMENGWITPNAHPCINDIKFNITGTKGMINIDLSNNQMIERFTEHKNDRPDVLVSHFVHGKAKGFAYESIRSFIDCILSGEDFVVSVEDAVSNSLVILAIMESVQKKQPIAVQY